MHKVREILNNADGVVRVTANSVTVGGKIEKEIGCCLGCLSSGGEVVENGVILWCDNDDFEDRYLWIIAMYQRCPGFAPKNIEARRDFSFNEGEEL